MIYRLKTHYPAFMVTDGPLSGRHFVHGRIYSEIPDGDRHRFSAEPIHEPAPDTLTPTDIKPRFDDDGGDKE